MITELLGMAKGLSGGSGAMAAPISSGGSSTSASLPVSFGSRTLGTGAMGGDTTASAPGASASGGSGGNSQTLWIVGIIAAAAVLVALVWPRKK